MQNFIIIETILRDREAFFTQIRDCTALNIKIRSMFVTCLTFLAVYGGVMGASHGYMQLLSSLVKLPILFLLTLIICTPSLYFFNLLFGSRQTVQQTAALILTAMTTTSGLLFGFAPITLFFLLTSSQYEFFKLLNVAFLGIAGWLGIVFLWRGMKAVTSADNKQGADTRRLIFVLWVLLYAFVGSQMTWTLRPFIGEPGHPFIVFSNLGGNIYADVLTTIQQLVGR